MILRSVYHLRFWKLIHWFEVRDLQFTDRLNSQRNRFVGCAVRPVGPQTSPCRPQDAEDLRTVEPLAFAVITETHDSMSPRSGNLPPV